MPRFNAVRDRTCCPECNGAPKRPGRATFDVDNATWTFDGLASDQTFTIEKASENASALVGRVLAAREPLPSFDAPAWVEGFFQRDVC